MQIVKEETRTLLYADEGRAIRRKESPQTVVTSAALSQIDAPENWEDCDLPDPSDDAEATEADKDAALRRFGVEV